MLHIGGHLQNLTPHEQIRPDYFVFDHMWTIGIISAEDYAWIMKYTERPYCSDLVPRRHETREIKLKRESNLRQIHDLAYEKRLMRKERWRSKGKETEATCHRPRETSQTQTEDKKFDHGRVGDQYRSDRLMPWRRRESRVSESNAEVDGYQKDYDKLSGYELNRKLDLVHPTDNFGRKIQNCVSGEDLDNWRIMPVEGDRSSSEHSATSSRNKISAASQTRMKTSSRATKLPSISMSDKPNISLIQAKQLQKLPDHSRPLGAICSSDRTSNSEPASNPPHTRPIATSNPSRIYICGGADSPHYNSETASIRSRESSSLDSGIILHNRTSSTGERLYSSRRSSIGYYEKRRYRTPDNGTAYSSYLYFSRHH
jgi:hypothetical protein